MSMDQLISKALAKTAYNGTISSATTTNGTAIDRTGYTDLLVVLQTGTVAGSSIVATCSIQMDDNSGFTSATSITGAAFAALDEDDDNVVRVGAISLLGAEQYIRPTIVTTGTVTSLPLNVLFLLGKGNRSLASGVGYTAAEWGFSVSVTS